MLSTILFTLILLKIKKQKISTAIYTFWIYPVFIFEGIHIFFQASVFFGDLSYVKYAEIIKSLYMLSLVLPVIFYKIYKPGIIASLSAILGTCLNKFVMIQNGGKMPVLPTLSRFTGYYKHGDIELVDSIHVLANDSTKFKYLADIFDTGFSIISIGDIFIRVFVGVIIFYSIKTVCENKRTEK